MSNLLFTPFFDFSGKKEILMTWQLLILGFLQDPCPKIKWNNLRFIKVQLFWEGNKNLRYVLFGFDIYLVSVKTMRKIAQIFVAFSEKLNFIRQKPFLLSVTNSAHLDRKFSSLILLDT